MGICPNSLDDAEVVRILPIEFMCVCVFFHFFMSKLENISGLTGRQVFVHGACFQLSLKEHSSMANSPLPCSCQIAYTNVGLALSELQAATMKSGAGAITLSLGAGIAQWLEHWTHD